MVSMGSSNVEGSEEIVASDTGTASSDFEMEEEVSSKGGDVKGSAEEGGRKKISHSAERIMNEEMIFMA
jgi:hypothetical protein